MNGCTRLIAHASGLGLFVAMVLMTGYAIAAEPPPELGDAAAGFYRSALQGSRGGVPDEKTRKRLAPHLSPSLAELLAQADAVEREYHDATRGEVPPLVEGDLFSSLFEGPEIHRRRAGRTVSDS